jgi:hypothetical protein
MISRMIGTVVTKAIDKAQDGKRHAQGLPTRAKLKQ